MRGNRAAPVDIQGTDMTSTAERKAKAVQLAVGIPMGWYQVAWAAELEPGGVKPLTVFEDDYVLYRTQSGEST